MRGSYLRVLVSGLGLAGLVAALAVAGAGAQSSAAPVPADRLGVEFEVRRTGESQYLCRTKVTELVSKMVLAEPQLEFQAGGPGQLITKAEGYEVEISVFVAAGGKRLDHVVILRRGGVVTATQAATVHLDL